MIQSVHMFFRQHEALFNRGAIASLTEVYDFPCAVHFDDSYHVYANADRLAGALGDFRSDLHRDGSLTVRVNVTVVELPRNQRRRCWVSWQHIDAQGRQIGVTDCLYFLRAQGNSYQIELVDCLRHQAIGVDHLAGLREAS